MKPGASLFPDLETVQQLRAGGLVTSGQAIEMMNRKALVQHVQDQLSQAAKPYIGTPVNRQSREGLVKALTEELARVAPGVTDVQVTLTEHGIANITMRVPAHLACSRCGFMVDGQHQEGCLMPLLDAAEAAEGKGEFIVLTCPLP